MQLFTRYHHITKYLQEHLLPSDIARYFETLQDPHIADLAHRNGAQAINVADCFRNAHVFGRELSSHRCPHQWAYSVLSNNTGISFRQEYLLQVLPAQLGMRDMAHHRPFVCTISSLPDLAELL